MIPPLRASAMMWTTVLAMLPSAAAAVNLYGAGVVIRILLAVGVAAAAECLCLRLRNKPPSIADGSAVLTGAIIGLAVPPLSPWYVVACASFFAITLAKHCYGGLGNNPFNPAMAGYALAFVAFPGDFADWTSAGAGGVGGDMRVAWESLFADGRGSPTPLLARRLSPEADAAAALAPPLAACAGGLLLVALRVADWRLPLSFILGGLAVAAIVGDGGGDWAFLLHGGLLFAAFFVVTDPVTAAATPSGRWLCGGLVGALAVWLRFRGAHADGIAFAILFGNIIAPLCDYPARRWRR